MNAGLDRISTGSFKRNRKEECIVSKSYIDAFIPEGKDANACVNCGVCLQNCPAMKMSKEESRTEIRRLIDGEDLRSLSCQHEIETRFVDESLDLQPGIGHQGAHGFFVGQMIVHDCVAVFVMPVDARG